MQWGHPTGGGGVGIGVQSRGKGVWVVLCKVPDVAQMTVLQAAEQKVRGERGWVGAVGLGLGFRGEAVLHPSLFPGRTFSHCPHTFPHTQAPLSPHCV